MQYLYGAKRDVARRLVATFDSEPQLLAYVRWATLSGSQGAPQKFEQGSVLASYRSWEHAAEPLTGDPADAVPHNPTPSML